MMDRLAARAEAVAERRAADLRDRIAERLETRVPGVAAAVRDDGVALRGRGLARRWLREPMLRWIGGYGK